MKEFLEHLATKQIKEAYEKAMKDKLEIYEFDDKEELTFTPEFWLKESLDVFELVARLHSVESLPAVATTLLSIFDSVVVLKYPERGEAFCKHMLKKILDNIDDEEREQLEEVFKEEIDELKKEGFEYEYAEEKHSSGKDGDFEYDTDTEDEEDDVVKRLADFISVTLEEFIKGEDDE